MAITVFTLTLFISTTTFAYTDASMVLQSWYQQALRAATKEVEFTIDALQAKVIQSLNRSKERSHLNETHLEELGIATTRHMSKEINAYAQNHLGQVEEARKALVGSSHAKGVIEEEFDAIILKKSKDFKENLEDQLSPFVDQLILEIDKNQDQS